MKLETGQIIALVMVAVILVVGIGLAVVLTKKPSLKLTPSVNAQRQPTSTYNSDNSVYSAGL